MQTEILSHDVQEGLAQIRFSHRGVTHTQNYDLGLVVPGTRQALAKEGKEFTLEMQQAVIEKIKDQVLREIEAGIICNPV